MREIPRKKREGNEREYPIKKVERRNPGACISPKKTILFLRAKNRRISRRSDRDTRESERNYITKRKWGIEEGIGEGGKRDEEEREN